MSKYIIRNCNVLYFNPDKTAICNDLNLECPCECKERTDCILKQIVELLKSPNNCRYSGKLLVFTDDILPLLDIEERE